MLFTDDRDLIAHSSRIYSTLWTDLQSPTQPKNQHQKGIAHALAIKTFSFFIINQNLPIIQTKRYFEYYSDRQRASNQVDTGRFSEIFNRHVLSCLNVTSTELWDFERPRHQMVQTRLAILQQVWSI